MTTAKRDDPRENPGVDGADEPRRPYHPPAVEEESEIENVTLGCSRLSGCGGGNSSS